MLTIRAEQMAVIAAAQFERLLDQAAADIAARHGALLAELQLDAPVLVRDAHRRAAAHGLVSAAAAEVWAELMLHFGVDFERDPSMQWVRVVASTARSFGESSAVQSLRDAVIESR
jgi:hypothetical protein